MQVHSCHGPARQIDVLREVLLGLLADDKTLEPRDILVMCPDIETYAPLIVAGFGLGDMIQGVHPAHQLRVRLADRSLVQTNPLLGVASQLLALAGGRATSSEVLNLAAAAPVRARFDFSDDDLEDITRWVREANIRWGFNSEHRQPFGVDFIQNTWRFGIDRVLAGVAMSDDSHAWIDTTLPLDDVSSNRVELAGRLAEYIDRLQHVVESLTGTRPLRDWLNALEHGIELLAKVDDDDAWQTSQLQREFADVLNSAGPRADTTMRLPDIRALLERHLAGRPTRANFRTGTLTVCTMVPMRSVPHRVVCLVGLDDGVFPRLGVVDGDDVLARDPMTGERDIRSEDRQLLLDAIGAASEKLVITYTGANEYSGQERPPAVPLSELLDTLDMTTPNKVRDTIVVKHPLQPFDTRNVIPGKLIPNEPFTFDPTVLRAARAREGDRAERPPFISGPLPAPPPEDVALADLAAFFRDPVKGFFRALDYTLPWEVDGVEDAMPVDINALEEWTVGDRMLRDMLDGMHPDQAREAEWRRGTLPPGRLGWRKATEIRDQAALLADAARQYRRVEPDAIDVDIDLGSGRRLTGTVSPVFGDRLVSVTYSKLDGRHLLQSWIPLLALLAHTHRAGTGRRSSSAAPRGEPRHGRRNSDAPQKPLSTCWPTWWRSTTRVGASRCRCRSRRRMRGRRPSTATAIRNGPRGSGGDPTIAIPGRTPRRRTSGHSARAPGCPHSSMPASTHTPAGYGCRCCERWTARDGPLRSVGSAARRTIDHGVGGQRGHRQDVRAGRSGHPLCRRRGGDAGPDAAHHLQPGGHPGTARPRAPPNRRCGSGFRRPRPGRRQPGAGGICSREPQRNCRTAVERLRDALAAFDAATIATTHQFCQLVLRSLGVAGDTDAGVTLVESLDELVNEIVDDLYLRHFGRERDDPLLAYADALRLAREVVNKPATELRPKDPAPTRAPRSASASRKTFWPNWRSASGVAASSATTICSADWPTRWTPMMRRLRCGCISGGRSCWSTSFRTPTRCSGR